MSDGVTSIRTMDNWQECERKLSEATDDYLAGRITVDEFLVARDMYGVDYRRIFHALAKQRIESERQERRQRRRWWRFWR